MAVELLEELGYDSLWLSDTATAPGAAEAAGLGGIDGLEHVLAAGPPGCFARC